MARWIFIERKLIACEDFLSQRLDLWTSLHIKIWRFEAPWKVELPHITSPDIGFRQLRLNLNQRGIISFPFKYQKSKLTHSITATLEFWHKERLLGLKTCRNWPHDWPHAWPHDRIHDCSHDQPQDWPHRWPHVSHHDFFSQTFSTFHLNILKASAKTTWYDLLWMIVN